MDGEVQELQLLLVQLIDHETDDLVSLLGDHADAVALSQDLEKILFSPAVREAISFDLEDLFHIASDHPADVDLNSLVPLNHVVPPASCRRLVRKNSWTVRRASQHFRHA